jgi:uncharacterized protein
MTLLVDAGPIVAMLDRRQSSHDLCRELLESSIEPIITCEAVIAEACYLLRRTSGAPLDLLRDVGLRRYTIDYRLEERALNVRKLMARYASVPMDLADACLVDLATIHNTGRILTLDADFRIYRWARNRPFELLIEVD